MTPADLTTTHRASEAPHANAGLGPAAQQMPAIANAHESSKPRMYMRGPLPERKQC
jgi:hypothetical protein